MNTVEQIPVGEEQMLDQQYLAEMEFETWLDSKRFEYERVVQDMGAFRRGLETLEVQRRKLASEIDKYEPTEKGNTTSVELPF